MAEIVRPITRIDSRSSLSNRMPEAGRITAEQALWLDSQDLQAVRVSRSSM